MPVLFTEYFSLKQTDCPFLFFAFHAMQTHSKNTVVAEKAALKLLTLDLTLEGMMIVKREGKGRDTGRKERERKRLLKRPPQETTGDKKRRKKEIKVERDQEDQHRMTQQTEGREEMQSCKTRRDGREKNCCVTTTREEERSPVKRRRRDTLLHILVSWQRQAGFLPCESPSFWLNCVNE